MSEERITHAEYVALRRQRVETRRACKEARRAYAKQRDNRYAWIGAVFFSLMSVALLVGVGWYANEGEWGSAAYFLFGAAWTSLLAAGAWWSFTMRPLPAPDRSDPS